MTKVYSMGSVPKDGTHVLLQIDDQWIEGWYVDKFQQLSRPDVISLDIHGCGCCGDYDDAPTAWAHLPDNNEKV